MLGGAGVQAVTSDYVVDEILTLIQVRFKRQAAIRAGQALFSERLSALVYISEDDIQEAWGCFGRTRTKDGASPIAPAML